MFRMIRRWMFRFIWIGLITAGLGLAAGGIRSHWRQDVMSIGWTREMSSEPAGPKRYQGLKLTWMSGDGGMGVSLQNIQQFHSLPGIRTALHRQTSALLSYPDTSMTMGLWIPRQNFLITQSTMIADADQGKLIYVGTIAENGTPVGYVQVIGGRGALFSMKTGDRLGQGRVIDVSLDEISYQPDAAATPTRIQLYYDLTGTQRMTPGSLATVPAGAAAWVTVVNPMAVTAPVRFVATELGSGIDPQWKTGDVTYVLIAPYWAMMAALGVVALPFSGPLRRAIRRRRLTRQGRCGVCGYDLRATPDRCPECGAVREAFKGVTA